MEAILNNPRTKPVAICVLLVAMLTLPYWIASEYRIFVATQVGVYMIVAIGMNFLSGYGGLVSMGQGALVAIGAYTAALLMVDHGVSFWLAALASLVIPAVVGCFMALLASRLSTWYFALITLTFSQVVEAVIVEWSSLTKGYAGVLGVPMPSLFGNTFTSTELYLLVALAVIGSFLLVRNLVNSRMGRALVASRDNPSAALASGVSLIRIRTFAFVVAAMLSGLAGAFYAVQKTVVTPDDFTVDFSIFFLVVVVLGGSGRLWGPVVGTLVFFVVPEFMTSLASWRILIYGVALLLLMIFAPHGVVGAITDFAKRFGGRKVATQTFGAATGAMARSEGSSLRVDNVHKRFGGVAALDGVSLDVPAGAAYAIVGPNGSGKTTLLNMISGFYRLDRGTIRVGDRQVVGDAPHAIARLGVGRTFQTPKLLAELSVIDNVMLGTYAHEKTNIAALALRLPRWRRENRENYALAMRYLEFVGLADRAHEPAGEVPHGYQRLAEIARALISGDKLLLLDEPAAGLSMSELERLVELIKAIQGLGTTVVIVEHHLDLVAQVCSEVTVLDRGKVLAHGTPKEVFADPAVVAAYVGRVAPVEVEA